MLWLLLPVGRPVLDPDPASEVLPHGWQWGNSRPCKEAVTPGKQMRVPSGTQV